MQDTQLWEYFRAIKSGVLYKKTTWNLEWAQATASRIEVFNHLGDEGWELVFHEKVENAETYTFKRRKA